MPGRTPEGTGPASAGRPVVDWQRLAEAARDAADRAYAPYSGFPVGAAALLEDGRVVTGCNVENASYGLTLCAECTLVGALQMGGGGRIIAFYCVDRQGRVLMPCGRCRQLLYEHRSQEMVLMTVSGVRTMDEVFPDAFGPQDLGRGVPPARQGGAELADLYRGEPDHEEESL